MEKNPCQKLREQIKKCKINCDYLEKKANKCDLLCIHNDDLKDCNIFLQSIKHLLIRKI